MQTKTIAAIIVAAGRGERAGGGVDALPKQYRPVAGKPILVRSVEALLGVEAVDSVTVMIHPEHRALYEALGLSEARLRMPVIGSESRQGSVRAGLESLAGEGPELVLIHDAARPLVETEVIEAVIAALDMGEAALPVLPVTDTIKRSEDGATVSATEDRRRLFAAQTPQGFRFGSILEAHRAVAGLGADFTDDAAIAEWAGLAVRLVPGSERNIKITGPGDFARAERLVSGGRAMETRIGTGFDVHPFTEGSGVWLGGIHIAHEKALEGHSDADVALHALTDALYGALGEGDIGTHFPPSEARWKGAASTLFLEHAAGLVAARGGRIVNLDVTIVCERPRIAAHVPAMRAHIAGACAIAPERVAVKATTSERLGFTGREEGIVAMASASIEVPGES